MTNTLTKFLTEVEEKLKKATPGPWSVEEINSVEHWFVVGRRSTGPVEGQNNLEEVCSFAMWSNPVGELANKTIGDARLIASCPAYLKRLVEICKIQDKYLGLIDQFGTIKDAREARQRVAEMLKNEV